MIKKAKKENNLLGKDSKPKKRIVIAMSGGIDSSVAAALLKESDDFEVIGIFMKFWAEDESERNNRCCSFNAERRARRVADFLQIPFYVFDFKKEFKKRIVDCFLKKNKEGMTPNPCIVCNKKIKFGLLPEEAHKLGADLIATGHYARTRESKDGVSLIKGRDKNKDQSYFLWNLSQKQLKHILFPVGGYTKNEVRKLAKDFKLPIVNFPESQEICFIPKTITEFLKKHLKTKPGKIIDRQTKKVIGKHEGLWFYTIGQRKRIKLPAGPFYVLNKDLKSNTLFVAKKEKDLYQKQVILKNVNWIFGKTPKLPLRIQAKIRYRHKAADVIISKAKDNKYKLQFKTSQRAITPGQSTVFYRRDEVLGGGIIC